MDSDVDIGEFFDAADREYRRNIQEEIYEGETRKEILDGQESQGKEYFDCESDVTGPEEGNIYAATSTPLPGRRAQTVCFRLSEEEDQCFVLLGRIRNKKKLKCVIYSSDSDNYPIQEVAAPRWKEKDIHIVKYVDDQTSAEKLDVSNCVKININGRSIGVKRAMKSEAKFRTIERNASMIGMKVNANKTQLLCISAACTFTPEPYFLDSQGSRIDSCEELKCLGFFFHKKPTARHHFECLLNKLRKCVWSLRHLRRSGFKQDELVSVYKAMIRPVAEYCCVVFHTLITEKESSRLDRFEAQCLKNIFGRKISYRKMLLKADIERLSERRQVILDKFAEKPLNHSDLKNGFLPPLYIMRRRLNGRKSEPIKSRKCVMAGED